MRSPLAGMLDLYVQQFKTTFASMVQYRASLFIWMILAFPAAWLIYREERAASHLVRSWYG